jgi:hypothetical protein
MWPFNKWKHKKKERKRKNYMKNINASCFVDAGHLNYPCCNHRLTALKVHMEHNLGTAASEII